MLARVLDASGRRRRPAPRDRRLLNAFLGTTLRRRCLESRGASYHWAWSQLDEAEFGRLLYPIVFAAAEFLTSPARLKIRTCAAADCGWLFLDTSRNGARRWCTMRNCGNRAKARRFYQHQTAATQR